MTEILFARLDDVDAAAAQAAADAAVAAQLAAEVAQAAAEAAAASAGNPKNSLEIDAGEMQLVGDEASPGNLQYYGTDAAGVKGWYTNLAAAAVTSVFTRMGDVVAEVGDYAAFYQPIDAQLDYWAGLAPAVDVKSVLEATDFADIRAILSLTIGTNVQAWDAQLDSLSAATANGVSLVTAANYAAMRALLDLEAGTDFYSVAGADAAFQTADADLATIAGLAATTNNVIQSVASAWASRTPAQLTATLPVFVGDAGAGGAKGLAPATVAGDATKFLRGDATWVTIAGGGDALVANPLSQFAATTSLQLLGVMSDETGTGALVFGTTPTLATPVLNGIPTGTGIGITNDLLLTAKNTPAAAEYARFTAAGLEGRTEAEFKADFNLEIGVDVQAFDADLSTWAGVTPAAGIATFLATPSSANLIAAITNETGSGALVFATSPVLVTPALGTPASGVLTNATGLPLTGLVNDTTTALGLGSINIGHASDTTLTRSAAGRLAVEGIDVALLTVAQTLTNKTLTDPAIIGTITEDVFIITDAAAFAINPRNGSVQQVTLSASRTPTVTGWLSGDAVHLKIADGTAFTITWTTIGVVWLGGSAPTLATSGFSHVILWLDGAIYYGRYIGDSAT